MKKRLLGLLCMGILLIGGALACRHFWFSLPVGEGPAGPPVPGDLFSETWSDRKVLLLGVGDSITAGLGAASTDHSYFNRLVANPSDEFPDVQGICLSAVLPNLRKENLAVSGSTSIYHVQMLRDDLEIQDPDTFGLVVMTSGGNDLIHSYGRMPPREGAMYGATLAQARPWIDNFEKRLLTMIDLLEERFPGGCLIFLADVYDPTDGVGSALGAGLPRWDDGLAIHRAYNDVIRRCAKDRSSVHLVPLHRAFLGHGIYCAQFWREHYQSEDPHYWYYGNIEDPNDRGYDAIRRLFLIEIAKRVTELQQEPAPAEPAT